MHPTAGKKLGRQHSRQSKLVSFVRTLNKKDLDVVFEEVTLARGAKVLDAGSESGRVFLFTKSDASPEGALKALKEVPDASEMKVSAPEYTLAYALWRQLEAEVKARLMAESQQSSTSMATSASICLPLPEAPTAEDAVHAMADVVQLIDWGYRVQKVLHPEVPLASPVIRGVSLSEGQ